jgi:hypothetical protein
MPLRHDESELGVKTDRAQKASLNFSDFRRLALSALRQKDLKKFIRLVGEDSLRSSELSA